MRNAELVNCENTAINLSGNVGRLDHKPPLNLPYSFGTLRTAFPTGAVFLR